MVNRTAFEEIGRRAKEISVNLKTEEATKQALVLPFISAMGYDIFNPTEVVPEYTADFGTKSGEKVDYAIIRGEETAILVECKKVDDPLDIQRASQLGRYFNVTKARIGVLTNGVRYLFFSDLETPNVMDDTPFMEIRITQMENRDFNNLKHFAKETFDVEQACAAAASLKYINGMKAYLNDAYQQPDDEFVRLLAKSVHPGPLTTNKKAMFTNLSRVAFQAFVNDRISSTLQKASDIAANLSEDDEDDEEHLVDSTGAPEKGIITTAEEVEAHELIRKILEPVVDPERVTMKDTLSYCGILLDNNSRRQLVRLHFYKNTKHIRVMNQVVPVGSGRPGTKRWGEQKTINTVEDIVQYSEEIRENTLGYLEGREPEYAETGE